MQKELLEKAKSQLGIKEIVGAQDNPEVLKYFDAMGEDGDKLKDETAWCSAFVNWVAIQLGVENSGKLTARSWLRVGTETKNPKPGDVVVFWRQSPNSWKGHVGFYVSETATHINVLGGNQGNEVKVAPYPKSRLLGYRILNCK